MDLTEQRKKFEISSIRPCTLGQESNTSAIRSGDQRARANMDRAQLEGVGIGAEDRRLLTFTFTMDSAAFFDRQRRTGRMRHVAGTARSDHRDEGRIEGGYAMEDREQNIDRVAVGRRRE